MMLAVLSLLASLLAGICAEYAAGITNPYLIIPRGGDKTQFLVFHGELRSNYTLARTRCIALGGELVDVDSLETLQYLTARIHGPAYIHGFLGDHFGEHCAAVFPGGAVAVPEFGCQSHIDSICEVPVLGTGSIHLGVTKEDYESGRVAVPQGAGSNATSPLGTKTDWHVVPRGFFRHGTNTQKEAKEGKQDGVVTTSIVIFGSIATNPVLPCCKCCG